MIHVYKENRLVFGCIDLIQHNNLRKVKIKNNSEHRCDIDKLASLQFLMGSCNSDGMGSGVYESVVRRLRSCEVASVGVSR